ncbi:transposase YhgA family protein, partial [Candidatus Magnetomorum sp. HK-1]
MVVFPRNQIIPKGKDNYYELRPCFGIHLLTSTIQSQDIRAADQLNYLILKIKRLFLPPKCAADFIKNYLPGNVVNKLDLSTVELERKYFINKQLKGMQSDLLYKLKTIDGKS